ncbi:MAG: TRAP transporter small permease [Elusimicrobia bacterium]|nr:TRAP transporter small permease [Elusimicrobiota bacterium]
MKKSALYIQKNLIIFEKYILITLLSVMVFFSFSQFFLRFFLNSGILWMDTFLRYTVLNTAMFSSAYVSAKSGHFALEFFSKKLPPSLAKTAGILSNTFAFLACCSLFISSASFVRQEYLAGAEAFSAFSISIKSFYFQICLPIGFLFSSFHFLINIFLPKNEESN